MDSAKNAVKGFMSKSGKHDTTVHETMAPAVTNETISHHRHENVTTAVDKEVHQDHYHTTIQPIQDKVVKDEKHHHNMAAVEHRKFEHGNDEEVQRRLQAEQAKFQDVTIKGDTHHTSSTAPVVTGEHIHHHVHENIQPVINRQVIEPHVIHTTVPIHETHHSAARHHETSALPAMSLADFKKQGGGLSGREQRTDFFEGEPREMAGHVPHREGDATNEFRHTGHVGQHGSDKSSGLTGSHHHTGTGSSGLTGSSGTTGTGSGLTGSHHTGTGSGLTGNGSSRDTTGGVSGGHGIDSTNSSKLGSSTSNTTTSKPSLLDRVNPFKDTDGDGKKGIMD